MAVGLKDARSTLTSEQGQFPMRVFVYVMTHLGDPDEDGLWGCRNCMGQKRSWHYDAVIGVGGVLAKKHRFGGKLNWIGIGPHKSPVRVDGRARHKVTFDQFKDFGSKGHDMHDVAPKLAKRIKSAPRGLMNLSGGEQAEAEELLELASKAQPSPALAKHTSKRSPATRAPDCKR